jgi:nucleotide-binding universal stress UspA family protein
MNVSSISGSLVVAVDGSDHANRAVDWAAEQAALEGRRLVVMHCLGGWRGVPEWMALWSADGDTLLEVVDAAGRDIVEAAAQRAKRTSPQIEVTPIVVDLDPRDALIEASTQAHTIIVGTHGRSIWGRVALGSVSSATSQHASCPVVIIGQPPVDAPRAGVLVGAEGTAESIPVIEFAFRFASQRALPLTVVHCYWDIVGEMNQGRHVATAEEGLAELRLLLSESVAGLAEKFPDVQVDLQLARGLVDVVLTDDEPPRDLVVVGRSQRSVWSRLLDGSVAAAVLDRAHGHVAVVPETPPIGAAER